MSIQNACHPARQNFKTALSRNNQECSYKENAIPLSILLYILNVRASSVHDVRKSGKFLLVKSGILCGIWNPGLWNPEYSSRNPEILLTIGIQNPSSLTETGIQ